MKICKMRLRAFLVLLGVVCNLSPVAAKAEGSAGGLFVEPAVTYDLGSTSVNYPAPLSNSTGNIDGFGLGARLGFHFQEAVFLGLDVRYVLPQFKDSTVSYQANAVATNWAPVVGMQMPNLGMRLWAAYILGGDLNPAQSGSFDVSFKNPSGYRIGAGFRISAFSLNVEYQKLRYGEAILEQLGPFSSSSALSGVNLDSQSWIASVSFPLEL